MNGKIRNILREAVSVERWAPKTNFTYSFLDDDEKEEIVDNILKYLEEKGYKIIKK